MSVVFFVVAIGVLVTVHEFGHFLVARMLGVKVLRFSVGFGKPLWTWRPREDDTEYVVGALPLGGYVQMLDEREGPVAENELDRAFNRKPLFSRIAVVAAGPLFNFLFAILAYWSIFVVGISGIKPIVGEVDPQSAAGAGGFQSGDQIVAINSSRVATWNSALLKLLDESLSNERVVVQVVDKESAQQQRIIDFSRTDADMDRSNLLENIGLRVYRPAIPPVIEEIEPGGPADRAGLRAADRVISVDGQPVEEWEDWVRYIRGHPGEQVEVSVERERGIVTLVVRPERVQTQGGEIGRIGARAKLPEDLAAELRATERYSAVAACGQAFHRTWDMTAFTLRMLANMVVGDVSVSNLGGPIRIAQYAGYSASVGMVQFIGFLALISISLGVLNLLPIPVLDGGHLLYFLIEAVQGRPLSEEAQLMGQRLGVAILIGVMVLAFYNDLVQVFG